MAALDLAHPELTEPLAPQRSIDARPMLPISTSGASLWDQDRRGCGCACQGDRRLLRDARHHRLGPDVATWRVSGRRRCRLMVAGRSDRPDCESRPQFIADLDLGRALSGTTDPV